jgi:prepilin-type N-terminal cleavage/methylation domain-containing protein
MKNQKSKTKNQKFTRPYCGGFTMAELLIALMITGMLLAAIAFAFSASVKNFNDNREIFLAANKARQALTQIIPRLRTAEAVTTSSDHCECDFYFYDTSLQHWRYRYSSSDNKLYLDDISNNSTHLLCDNVANMSFTPDSPANVKSVIISITVTEGSISQRFDTAVVIRKNL